MNVPDTNYNQFRDRPMSQKAQCLSCLFLTIILIGLVFGIKYFMDHFFG